MKSTRPARDATVAYVNGNAAPRVAKSNWVAGATRRSARQRTLKSAIGCSGVGLHSGHRVRMNLIPADCDTGIVFRRTDVCLAISEIRARWDRVIDGRLCTVIANEAGTSVGTIEHLMAAFAGCHIDNVIVEISGPEVPVMDGSSEPFVFLIECAGVIEQDQPRRAIEILKPVSVLHADKQITVSPAPHFAVHFAIAFDNPVIGKQECTVRLVNGTFKKQIARARTFGFEDEVNQLRAAGLARGGSLMNAVVVSGDRVLNEDGLRFRDEFVRHKALDCIGDLYLAGGPILGAVSATRSGHALNHQLLRALFADQRAWRLTSHPADGDAKTMARAANG